VPPTSYAYQAIEHGRTSTMIAGHSSLHAGTLMPHPTKFSLPYAGHAIPCTGNTVEFHRSKSCTRPTTLAGSSLNVEMGPPVPSGTEASAAEGVFESHVQTLMEPDYELESLLSSFSCSDFSAPADLCENPAGQAGPTMESRVVAGIPLATKMKVPSLDSGFAAGKKPSTKHTALFDSGSGRPSTTTAGVPPTIDSGSGRPSTTTAGVPLTIDSGSGRPSTTTAGVPRTIDSESGRPFTTTAGVPPTIEQCTLLDPIQVVHANPGLCNLANVQHNTIFQSTGLTY